MDPPEWVQSGQRSHATANHKASNSGETLNNKDDSSYGCQPASLLCHPHAVCLHSRAKNEVTTVAGIEAMHGPNGMDSHLSMLNT